MPSPLETALDLQSKGLDEGKIAAELSSKGFSKEEISQALTQTQVKSQVEDLPEAPAPELTKPETDLSQFQEQTQETSAPTGSQQFQTYSSSTQQQIEEIAEEIIQEKWERFLENFGDLPIWKEKIENDILSTKQEIARAQDRMNGVERALAGKVQEYSNSITDLTAEMKAISKLIKQILQPLTSNVKELQRITDKFKGKE